MQNKSGQIYQTEFIKGIGEIISDKDNAINCINTNIKIPLKPMIKMEIIWSLKNNSCNSLNKAGGLPLGYSQKISTPKPMG